MVKRRMRNILDAQRSTRKDLVQAARTHAFLAAAPSQLMEVDGGWITNRAGVYQRLTIFIRVDPVNDRHPFDPDGTQSCKTCGGGPNHYLHKGDDDGPVQLPEEPGG